MQWHQVRKGFIAFLRKYCLREGVPWKENDLSVGACSGDLVRVCLFSTCVTSGGSGAGGQGASGSEEGIKHGGARWTCVHGARWTCVHGERSSGLSWRQASAGGVGTKWPLTKWARWTGWLLTKWTSGQGYRVILLFSPNYSYRGQVGGVVKVRKQFLGGYLMVRSVKWQTWTITRWETKISFFILVLYVFNKV